MLDVSTDADTTRPTSVPQECQKMGSGKKWILITSPGELLIIYSQLLATIVTQNEKPIQYDMVINTQTVSFYKIVSCMFGKASVTNLVLEELTLHKAELHIIVSSSVTQAVFSPSLLFSNSHGFNLPQEL